MMTQESSDDELFDEFLESRGHDTEGDEWEVDENKFQCPECGGIHNERNEECNVCGWRPD